MLPRGHKLHYLNKCLIWQKNWRKVQTSRYKNTSKIVYPLWSSDAFAKHSAIPLPRSRPISAGAKIQEDLQSAKVLFADKKLPTKMLFYQKAIF